MIRDQLFSKSGVQEKQGNEMFPKLRYVGSGAG
jgi:hypothetical protein